MNSSPQRPFFLILSSVTVALLFGAVTARAAVGPLSVVSVGDSYASGEGAMGAGWLDVACHLSALAGPQAAASQLGTLRATSFKALACSGSVTGSFTGAGVTLPSSSFTLLGPMGQLAALAAGGPVDALTMSIGGNDLGFSGIVEACMFPAPAPECWLDPLVTGPLGAAIAALPARLDQVVAAVPANVRNVFVTEYPDPTTGPFDQTCGSGWTPAFEGLEGVDWLEATFASGSLVAPLNAALEAMVARANALPGPHPVWTFVGGISSRFAGHGYCTGGGSPAFWVWPIPRFINTPIDSLVAQGDVMGTMHPNDLGQMEIGTVLFEAIRFLASPLKVNLSVSPTPAVVGTPTNVTITTTTTAGTPAVGASVFLDGSYRGATNQLGTFALAGVVFGATGPHTLVVDLNPYPTATSTFQVLGSAPTCASNQGQACGGCGGVTQCDGACSEPIGHACRCGRSAGWQCPKETCSCL